MFLKTILMSLPLNCCSLFLVLLFLFFLRWTRVGKQGTQSPSVGYPAYINRVDDVLGTDTLLWANSFQLHCKFVSVNHSFLFERMAVQLLAYS